MIYDRPFFDSPNEKLTGIGHYDFRYLIRIKSICARILQ